MTHAEGNLSIYILKAAERECIDGKAPDELAAILADAWIRLRSTRGSKVKKLRFVPGNAWRMRIAAQRTVFSPLSASGGHTRLYIHQIGPRCNVYKEESFLHRLKLFSESVDSTTNVVDADLDQKYRMLDWQAVSAAMLPKGSISLLPTLRQEEFLEQALSAKRAPSDRGAKLLIGHGPPGSGKTLVAGEMAKEATLAGTTTDILVPSSGLRDEYWKMFKDSRNEVDAIAVRVFRFDEYFAKRAGIKKDEDDRRQDDETKTFEDRIAKFQGWWRRKLNDPRFKARINQGVNGLSTQDLTSRLPVLLDALLEDEIWWGQEPSARTGALVQKAIEMVEFLQRNQLRGDLLEDLDASAVDPTSPILTRAGLASKAPDPTWLLRRAGLVIVDEAQDLAPAEWRALLKDLVAPGSTLDSRQLVLLGDTRQRVSLVPFTWEQVKRFAGKQCRMAGASICEKQVDSVSYRMRRKVATAAQSVWDKLVVEDDASRNPGKIDVSKLAEGGSVEVVLADPQKWPIEDILNRIPKSGTGNYGFVVHGPPGPAGLSPKHLIPYTVREVKGLEEDKIIVVYPFGTDVSKPRERVPVDDATAFYTAVSRAREHALLVLSPEAWEELRRNREDWQGVSVWKLAEMPDLELDRLLRKCLVSKTDEEVKELLLDQLWNASQDPTSIDGPVCKRLLDILDRLMEWVDDDLPFALIDAGKQLAELDQEALTSICREAFDRLDGDHIAEAVGPLLYVGETALAARVAGKGQSVGNWNAEWLEEIARTSRWQAWRLDEDTDAGKCLTTSDRVKGVVYEQVREAISSSPVERHRAVFEAADIEPQSDSTAADLLATQARTETMRQCQQFLENAEVELRRRIKEAVREGVIEGTRGT